ncbi:MAG: winged helix-turn-helix transcriptional regulator [Methylobacteriaceae bacterium]|nr:winged helix-turn-helix transcriptional regulator [Methylobacteriaceae bacterium]
MGVEIKPAQALRLFHDIACGLAHDEKPANAPDFTLRQIIILLTVYLEPPPHTVRGLAKKLGVTKPVITRALNAMGRQKLVDRRRDLADRRNVIVRRTVGGALYVEGLGDMIVAQAAGLSNA